MISVKILKGQLKTKKKERSGNQHPSKDVLGGIQQHRTNVVEVGEIGDADDNTGQIGSHLDGAEAPFDTAPHPLPAAEGVGIRRTFGSRFGCNP